MNALRFKTQTEFEAEFGENWRYELGPTWYEQMDYLFGKPCELEWIDKWNYMYGEEYDSHCWAVTKCMATDKPLPEAKLETPHPEETLSPRSGTINVFSPAIQVVHLGDDKVLTQYGTVLDAPVGSNLYSLINWQEGGRDE